MRCELSQGVTEDDIWYILPCYSKLFLDSSSGARGFALEF